ncbi:hypothetical protein ACLBWZ_09690 [Brucellaceae bacterium C25G]
MKLYLDIERICYVVSGNKAQEKLCILYGNFVTFLFPAAFVCEQPDISFNLKQNELNRLNLLQGKTADKEKGG